MNGPCRNDNNSPKQDCRYEGTQNQHDSNKKPDKQEHGYNALDEHSSFACPQWHTVLQGPINLLLEV